MSAQLELEIEEVLGVKLSSLPQGNIHNLYDFPAEFIQMARQLNKLACYVFVWHLTDQSQRPFVPNFIEDIVYGKKNLAAWGKGKMLVPSFGAADLISRNVAQILEALKHRPGEKWVRIKPERRDWNNCYQSGGAPGIFRPELDYRYRSKATDNSHTRLPSSRDTIEEIDDITIATRQWMASRFAMVAADKGLLRLIWEPQELIEVALPGTVPSADALIAVRALILEEKTYQADRELVPGFHGPPEWFME